MKITDDMDVQELATEMRDRGAPEATPEQAELLRMLLNASADAVCHGSTNRMPDALWADLLCGAALPAVVALPDLEAAHVDWSTPTVQTTATDEQAREAHARVLDEYSDVFAQLADS